MQLYAEKLNRKKGFTIVEILVVAGLVALLSVILISNFPKTRFQLSLSRVAHKFGQDVRRAQNLALSAAQYKDANGAVLAVKGYGVYLNKNEKSYILYADRTPGNQHYDSSDYIVETINFATSDPGIFIKELTNLSGQDIDINFTPPHPTTNIKQLIGNNTTGSVVFSISSNQTTTKTVSINTAGLIEVR